MANVPLEEETIFKAACKISSPEARAKYVQKACAGDPVLLGRLEALLRVYDEEQSFLESPPHGMETTEVRAATLAGVGDTIGPYTLLEEIGEGGMGVVYLAEQHRPIRRRVALKIVKPGMDTRDVIARFESERQALAMMDHPNIAHVLDAGTTESGRPYFVMELVCGTPLIEYCDRHRVGLADRLRLFVAVCRGVQHAHQKGIIHRDLKPSNLLVVLCDGVPVPKIIDFGIAKALSGRLSENTVGTAHGQVLGTPLYMSPEQLAGADAGVDTRSDIYSLGVVLYELLTGTTPFDRQRMRQWTYDELRRRVCEDQPPRPSTQVLHSGDTAKRSAEDRGTDPVTLARQLRRELDWIVMKCLEKDPNRRYETANGLARDVERYLRHEPVQACPPSAAYRFGVFARRHRVGLGAGLAALAALLLGIVVSTWQAVRATHAEGQARQAESLAQDRAQAEFQARQLADYQRTRAEELAAEARRHQSLAEDRTRDALHQRELARKNLYLAQMRLAQQDYGAGQTARLQQMLDSYLPSAGQADLRGWEWFYLLSLCHSEQKTLAGHSLDVLALAWSPDGQRLASADGDRTIRLWEVATGQTLRTVTTDHPDNIHRLAWTPDGRWLASASADQIRVWDAASGKNLHTFLMAADRINTVAWAPDSRRLAVIVGTRLEIWDGGAGTPILSRSVEPPREVSGVAWSPDGAHVATSADWPGSLVKIYEATTGKEQASLAGHDGTIYCLAWNPQSHWLASASADQTVKVWDVEARREWKTLAPQNGWVTRVTWAPDGRYLALATAGSTVQVWDAATGTKLRTFRGHLGPVSDVAWSPDGKHLASAGGQVVRMWDPHTDPEVRHLRGHGAIVRAVAWSPDGRQLASAASDRRILFWDPTTRTQVRALQGHAAELRALAWGLPDRLASVDTSGQVIVWDLSTNKALFQQKLAPSNHLSLAFHPKGRLLAGASFGHDTSIILWDVATGQQVARLEGHRRPVGCVRWRPDGRGLATGAQDGTLLWNAPFPQPATPTKLPPANWTLAWSPDGQLLAGATGNLVTVWRAATAQRVLTLSGHTGCVLSLAWHPHGRRLASSAEEGAIKLWDMETGLEILTLQAADKTRDIAWSPDGQRLAAAAGDTVQVWDASIGYHLAAEAQSRGHPQDPSSPPAQGPPACQQGSSSPPGQQRQPHAAQPAPPKSPPPSSTVSPSDELVQLDRAIELDPRDPQAFLRRAAYFRDKNECEKTLADFAKGLAVCQPLAFEFPDEPQRVVSAARRYHDFAWHLTVLGKLRQSELAFGELVAFWTRLAERFPNTPEYRYELAYTYCGLGGPLTQMRRAHEAEQCNRQAVTLLEKLVAEAPDNRTYRSFLAENYFYVAGHQWRQVQVGEAKRLYRQAVTHWEKVGDESRDPPGPAWLHLARGRSYFELGQPAEAITHFQKAVELAPEHVMVLRSAAWYVARFPGSDRAMIDKAMRWAQKAAERDPRLPSCWNTLGVAHYRAGNWKEAIEALNKAHQLRGDNSYDLLFLAMAYWQLGQKDEARKAYQQAIEHLPFERPLAQSAEEIRRFRAEAEQLLAIQRPE